MWRALGILAIVGLGMTGGYIGLLVSDRDQPVSVVGMKALTPEVEPGDQLRVQYTVRRFRSCRTKIDRQVFDSEKTRFVLTDLDFPSGLPVGDDTYIVPVKIPVEATPGPATYRVIAQYECNFVHRFWPITAPAREIFFRIG